ncbi:MAG: cation:proton antiporter [Deltaproteobacteria bacterium]|nr:cation:proton antiporter [Deltaproteobacteria bacterium]
MENITLVLAILLGAGFAGAWLCKLVNLPSVTGYICVGLLLGPSGLNLFSGEAVGAHLGHFIQIALMLISFGIGEHMEISRLRSSAKSVFLVGLGESLGAFVIVSLGCFIVIRLTGLTTMANAVVLAILLGSVSIATAPATTMHVIREIKAAGPLTTSLLAVIALDNGLAIMIFGITLAAVKHFTNTGQMDMTAMLYASLLEIGGAILLGIITGLLLDFVNSHLQQKSEILTAGLALLLLCGEAARIFGMSPLLAGMAAGFTIVNREHRDIRIFRTFNSFEPPIYVLFFTLAGVHLNLAALATAGWLGLAYFLCRTIGKIGGAGTGALLSKSPVTVKRYLGLALTPQAGVAIGLIFLINNDATGRAFAGIITPVVLAGVFMSETLGPILTKLAVKLAGEIPAAKAATAPLPTRNIPPDADSKGAQGLAEVPAGVPLVPWTWPKISTPIRAEGVVLFSATHLATGAALARMAAIMANYYQAYPMMARIIPQAGYNADMQDRSQTLLAAIRAEVSNMGSELYTVASHNNDIVRGILEVAAQSHTWGIVLGYALVSPAAFQDVIDRITAEAPCPTMIIKFSGVFHTERILVPFFHLRDLEAMKDPLKALAAVGQHRISLLRLMASSDTEQEVLAAKQQLVNWAAKERLSPLTTCEALATEARKETILREAKQHDLLLMAGPPPQALPQRLLFGSLHAAIAKGCEKTLVTVYPPGE